MPDPPPSRFRQFFSRIKKFLTPKQFSRVKSATSAIPPPTTPTPEPATRAGEPAAPSAAATTRGPPDAEALRAAQRRVEELRKVEREAREERERIETKVAAQKAPIRALRDLVVKPGFRYDTWFKAFGTFGDLRDKDSPRLLGEMTELEDFDVPSAFHSGAKLGKVKWAGQIRDREQIIRELNDVAFFREDFRELYPKWEYRYYVAEMVGNVVVQIYEHEAQQPLDKKLRGKGVMGR